jgi:phosphohistidine phosphatase
MKYLTVIRHAKSCWDQSGLADHDRPLNARGRKAAPAVASFLYQTYLGGDTPLLPTPDRVISSTAVRAATTAQLLREGLRLPLEALQLDSQLYLASATRLLQRVRDLDENWRHAVLVGHNPGMHDFIERLLARAHVARLPTCTAVLMALPQAYWGLADWQTAQLIGYVTPKSLERRFPELYFGISRQEGEV